jgi:hypothetical protein
MAAKWGSEDVFNILYNSLHTNPMPGTSKIGFVKIMKEFVWIIFFSKFGFWARRWKNVWQICSLILNNTLHTSSLPHYAAIPRRQFHKLFSLILCSISLCHTFFHLLAQKPNLEKKIIQTNSFIIFTNPILLVPGIGLVWRLKWVKIVYEIAS